MAHLAALELQSIGKSLFVSAHKGSKLLFSKLAYFKHALPSAAEIARKRIYLDE